MSSRFAFPMVLRPERVGTTLHLRPEPPPVGSQRYTRFDRLVERHAVGIERVVLDLRRLRALTQRTVAPLRCLVGLFHEEGVLDIELVNTPAGTEDRLADMQLMRLVSVSF